MTLNTAGEKHIKIKVEGRKRLRRGKKENEGKRLCQGNSMGFPLHGV